MCVGLKEFLVTIGIYFKAILLEELGAYFTELYLDIKILSFDGTLIQQGLRSTLVIAFNGYDWSKHDEEHPIILQVNDSGNQQSDCFKY